MKDTENQPLMQEQEKTDAVKDIKQLVEAFSAVFRHQHGQEPTQEDISKFLAEKKLEEEEPENLQDSPSILKYKVFFGKTNKPLFFGHDSKYFDCNSEQWHGQAPAVVSELNERPITTADLYYAIMHGLVNDMDYDTLAEKNLIPPESQKLYEKLKKLNETVEQLKMSQEDLEKTMPETNDEDFSDESWPSSEENSVEDEYLWPHREPEAEEETNIVAEIIRLAMEKGLAPELESAIRKIVQEEIFNLRQSESDSNQSMEALTDDEIEQLDLK